MFPKISDSKRNNSKFSASAHLENMFVYKVTKFVFKVKKTIRYN